MTHNAEKDEPTTLYDRHGREWTSLSGIWYRKSKGMTNTYDGECRGTLTMLHRDFGPLSTTPAKEADRD